MVNRCKLLSLVSDLTRYQMAAGLKNFLSPEVETHPALWQNCIRASLCIHYFALAVRHSRGSRSQQHSRRFNDFEDFSEGGRSCISNPSLVRCSCSLLSILSASNQASLVLILLIMISLFLGFPSHSLQVSFRHFGLTIALCSRIRRKSERNSRASHSFRSI